MALITKQNRVRAEYKMYKDISDMIKLHDDTMIHINDLGNLGLEKGMVEVIQKLYERKGILKEISYSRFVLVIDIVFCSCSRFFKYFVEF